MAVDGNNQEVDRDRPEKDGMYLIRRSLGRRNSCPSFLPPKQSNYVQMSLVGRGRNKFTNWRGHSIASENGFAVYSAHGAGKAGGVWVRCEVLSKRRTVTRGIMPVHRL